MLIFLQSTDMSECISFALLRATTHFNSSETVQLFTRISTHNDNDFYDGCRL